MSRPSFRGRLKAAAVDFVRLLSSPSTRKDNESSFPMKKRPLAIVLAFIGGCPFGFAGDEQTAISEKSTSEITTTARVLGDLPDGTPPPPEPPKPEFIVPEKDILETKIHEQGGRQITVRKISPIALPQPAKIAAPPAPDNPAIQERVVEVQAEHPDQELLFVGATVFHAKDATVRSLVQIWPQGKGLPVTFWSSADFSLLSGFASFAGSDGETHSLIMSWSTEEIDTMAGFIEKQGRAYGISKAPELPAGKATFAVTSEKPTDETLASIQSLHDLYNNEHDRLKTAYQGRERARIQHEAELKAHPPKPKDIVLNYWRIERPASAKGGAK